MNSLQLVSTKDLVEELENRVENCVIAYNRDDKVKEDKQDIDYWYKGDWLKCLGLVSYLQGKSCSIELPKGID